MGIWRAEKIKFVPTLLETFQEYLRKMSYLRKKCTFSKHCTKNVPRKIFGKDAHS